MSINDMRYLIDPETLEHVWIPNSYRIVRVAKHPKTGETLIFPRNQFTNHVTLMRDGNSIGAASRDPDALDSVTMELPTRLVLSAGKPLSQTN